MSMVKTFLRLLPHRTLFENVDLGRLVGITEANCRQIKGDLAVPLGCVLSAAALFGSGSTGQ